MTAPFIKRVTIACAAFLGQIYRDFGLDDARAAIWARSSYAAHLGVQLLRHSHPSDPVMAALGPEYIDQVVIQLTPGA